MAKPDTSMPWELARFRNWVACGKVNQLVRRSLSDGLSDIDLDLPEYDVLAAVFRFPGISQSELADKLLVGRSNLSMLLPDLEDRRLIKREVSDADKRVRLLYLTANGKKLAAAGLSVQVKLINHMSNAIEDDECDLLGDLMRRVGAYLEDQPFKAKQ